MKKQNRIEKINEITKKPSWESRRGFIRSASKIVHEWNGHLEIFSLPQGIENSSHFCLSEQILQRKQSLGAPNKYKLAVPTPHTEFYKRSLSHNGNLLWNSLTLEVRQLTSLYVFKGKLNNLNLKIRNIFT